MRPSITITIGQEGCSSRSAALQLRSPTPKAPPPAGIWPLGLPLATGPSFRPSSRRLPSSGARRCGRSVGAARCHFATGSRSAIESARPRKGSVELCKRGRPRCAPIGDWAAVSRGRSHARGRPSVPDLVTGTIISPHGTTYIPVLFGGRAGQVRPDHGQRAEPTDTPLHLANPRRPPPSPQNQTATPYIGARLNATAFLSAHGHRRPTAATLLLP